jgi:serine/threonine-protein kinase
MGEVYRAIDSVLERPVAVKLLSDRQAQESEARARFRREALAAARVSNSQYVVTIFDVDEYKGRPLIVMEYVEGGSVHDALRRGRVPREQALRWLTQAGEGLDRAHAEGVVHRDVKPANLLLDDEGNVRVSDFGIASTSGLESITLPGTILGTVGYLSPEQARGEPATAASDRYGLAVVGFELLTGHRPFESDTATTEILAHVNADVPKASEFVGSDLPAAVDAVFHRALAKDPTARPSSCQQFVSDLRDALAGTPTAVRPPIATRAGPEAPTRRLAVRTSSVRSPSGRGWIARTAALAAATVLAAVALLSVFGGFAGGGHSAAPPSPSRHASTLSTRPPDGIALNDLGFARMSAGNYTSALAPLQASVFALKGTGSIAEAYASYNLAYTRFALGDCNGVMGLLARSARLQGHRWEIDALRSRWHAKCAPVPVVVSSPDHGGGNGNGNGQGQGQGEGGDGD